MREEPLTPLEVLNGLDALVASCRLSSKTIEKLAKEKAAAYAERNKLVLLLAKMFPAHLELHPESDASWEADWRWIVSLDIPGAQSTFHIHDSERDAFAFLPFHPGAESTYDDHTTEQKFDRLLSLSPSALFAAISKDSPSVKRAAARA